MLWTFLHSPTLLTFCIESPSPIPYVEIKPIFQHPFPALLLPDHFHQKWLWKSFTTCFVLSHDAYHMAFYFPSIFPSSFCRELASHRLRVTSCLHSDWKAACGWLDWSTFHCCHHWLYLCGPSWLHWSCQCHPLSTPKAGKLLYDLQYCWD